MTRRDLLSGLGAGFGSVGLASMLQAGTGAGPLAAKTPPLPARAKHVIFLFLNGGMSQVDTFDPKPSLDKRDGEPMPGPKVRTDRAAGNLMKSPFEFRKRGQSGIEVSEIFPQVSEAIDDFCVIRSMYSDNGNHTPSLFLMNCGHQLPGRPSMGSWVTYGLGTENQDLPGFIVLCPGMPNIGPQLWSSAFLPSSYQGAYIPLQEKALDRMVQNIHNPELSPQRQMRQLDLLSRLNRSYLDQIGNAPEIESGIQAMEIAFKMQTSVPDVFNLDGESEKTKSRYGSTDFGRGCLLALRMIEKGVRMVQVYYDNYQPWDSHDDIRVHAHLARGADPAIAALIQDLKSRGLFDETVVVVASEFGRTPMIQNSGLEKIGRGRDHNIHGFTTLLAGGGIKGGITYGATDEFGYKAIDKPVHVHDLHATMLWQLGLDHTRLTYRYSGRDYRLTDVAGSVVKDIIA